MKKRFRFCIISALLVFLLNLFGCARGGEPGEDTKALPPAGGELTITVLQAGQADAIVITTQNRCMVIDCGEKDDDDKILQYLKEKQIKNIDCLVITHFDKDHIGGAPKILSNVTAEKIFVPDYRGKSDEYDKFIKALDNNGLTQTVLTEDVTLVLDDVLFEIYPPQKSTYSTPDNDFSLVVSARHGDLSFLFAGDAEAERISEITAQLEGPFDFLKIPHHGRYGTKTAELVEFARPSIAVITDSDKNPADERTLAALEDIGCKAYCTKDGTVTVKSDGANLTAVQ